MTLWLWRVPPDMLRGGPEGSGGLLEAFVPEAHAQGVGFPQAGDLVWCAWAGPGTLDLYKRLHVSEVVLRRSGMTLLGAPGSSCAFRTPGAEDRALRLLEPAPPGVAKVPSITRTTPEVAAQFRRAEAAAWKTLVIGGDPPDGWWQRALKPLPLQDAVGRAMAALTRDFPANALARRPLDPATWSPFQAAAYRLLRPASPNEAALKEAVGREAGYPGEGPPLLPLRSVDVDLRLFGAGDLAARTFAPAEAGAGAQAAAEATARAEFDHQALLAQLKDLALAQGFLPLRSASVDLAVRAEAGFVLVEVKSAGLHNLREQVLQGAAQVTEYAEALAREGEQVALRAVAVQAVDADPAEAARLQEVCRLMGVRLVWVALRDGTPAKMDGPAPWEGAGRPWRGQAES